MPDHTPAHLYEQDFAAWATSQASTLRAAAAALAQGRRGGTGLLRTLDLEHLAEEIEGLALRDRRELGSRMALIAEHLAKLEFSPAVDPRAGWEETVMRERREIEAILRDSPSLRAALPRLLADNYQAAIRTAAPSLRRFGEADAEAACLTRLDQPYALDAILGAWLPEAPNT